MPIRRSRKRRSRCRYGRKKSLRQGCKSRPGPKRQSPKRSPRKVRRSRKQSPRKVRRSRKRSLRKVRRSRKRSPRKVRKSRKRSPRKVRKSRKRSQRKVRRSRKRSRYNYYMDRGSIPLSIKKNMMINADDDVWPIRCYWTHGEPDILNGYPPGFKDRLKNILKNFYKNKHHSYYNPDGELSSEYFCGQSKNAEYGISSNYVIDKIRQAAEYYKVDSAERYGVYDMIPPSKNAIWFEDKYGNLLSICIWHREEIEITLRDELLKEKKDSLYIDLLCTPSKGRRNGFAAELIYILAYFETYLQNLVMHGSGDYRWKRGCNRDSEIIVALDALDVDQPEDKRPVFDIYKSIGAKNHVNDKYQWWLARDICEKWTNCQEKSLFHCRNTSGRGINIIENQDGSIEFTPSRSGTDHSIFRRGDSLSKKTTDNQRIDCGRFKKTKDPKCLDQVGCKWLPSGRWGNGRCINALNEARITAEERKQNAIQEYEQELLQEQSEIKAFTEIRNKLENANKSKKNIRKNLTSIAKKRKAHGANTNEFRKDEEENLRKLKDVEQKELVEEELVNKMKINMARLRHIDPPLEPSESLEDKLRDLQEKEDFDKEYGKSQENDYFDRKFSNLENIFNTNTEGDGEGDSQEDEIIWE